jgi:hypothetical protein
MQRTIDPGNLIRVKKGPLQQTFTKTQWDALGPDKGGWEIDRTPPKEVLELQERQKEQERNNLLHDRVSDLIVGGSMNIREDEGGGVVYSSAYGVVSVTNDEIASVPAEAWPFVKGSILSRVDSLKMLENALGGAATAAKAPEPAVQEPAPAKQPEPDAPKSATETTDAPKEEAEPAKKGGRPPKSATDEGKK